MLKNKTEVREIKAAIARLHATGSSDFEAIARGVNRNLIRLEYNRPQFVLMELMTHFKVIFNIWGRGTGKTTAMGGVVKNIVTDMPRSLNIIETSSFHKFFTEIIPSLRSGLEKHGLYEDLHYFIGKKPPRSWGWTMPYQYPKDDKNMIYFYTGAAYVLVSQDAKGGGLGLNVDSLLCDEAKLINFEKHSQQVSPTKRGSNVQVFKDKSSFMSEIFFTSQASTQKDMWIVDYVERLKYSGGLGTSILAPTTENEHNLAPGFINDQRKLYLHQALFNAEFFNIVPKKTTDAFYALFSEQKHGYVNYTYTSFNGFNQNYESSSAFDGDVIPEQEIILGLDFGARINFAVALQIIQGERKEFRALKEFFVLYEHGETQRELARDFAKYYRLHKRKVVKIVCDTQGFYATGMDIRNRSDIFRDDLEKEGWTVYVEQIGMVNPLHHLRRTLWELIFKEDNAWMPIFRINLENCKNTVIALQNVRVMENRKGEISKDKSAEKAGSGVKPQHAPHPTDALDYPCWFYFAHLMETKGVSLPDFFSSSR